MRIYLSTHYHCLQDLIFVFNNNNENLHWFYLVKNAKLENFTCFRYEFQYKLPVNKGIYATMEKTNIKKSPSPLDTPMFSGSAYYIWKREAVEFMLRGTSAFVVACHDELAAVTLS